MSHRTSLLGFPRIGEHRELKFALEQYWKGALDFDALDNLAQMLRARHFQRQKASGIDEVAINDFSFYDNMLDMMVALGSTPERFGDIDDPVARYFAMARGDSTHAALEMTKWFNTNYHYLVPELHAQFRFAPVNPEKILREYAEAQAQGIHGRIALIGPITFLALSKCDEQVRGVLFDGLLNQYAALLEALSPLQAAFTFHESALVCDPSAEDLSLLKIAYERLGKCADIRVATYFEHASEATAVLLRTPITSLALDFVHGPANFDALEAIGKSTKTLVVGIINGRNVWKNDLEASLRNLEQIALHVPKERLIIGTSCSLLHVPYSLDHEHALPSEVRALLAFAHEKLEELALLSRAFFEGEALPPRLSAPVRSDDAVQARLAALTPNDYRRPYPFAIRREAAKELFDLPILPTTTIGSFPQTPEIRKARQEFKKGLITPEAYETAMKEAIAHCVSLQESLGLDVLVHGEFERNDMVEYFGEQLRGFAFSANGWVQSYGSRCVKPPLLYADVSRIKPMTHFWSSFAQSLTDKPMKGMLTGPVTILNWSFVREDQSREQSAKQIALAISDEIDDLQRAGIKMIQVDEAAFKEGYPLRRSEREKYERWALESFLLATAIAERDTQIHTHMCYSEFTDIIHTIEAMDADVISIETSRSGNRLLRIFEQVGYKQEIGPGVYDIHSPRVPSVEEIEHQIRALLEVLSPAQLWINPDCGLKTRGWSETEAALRHMVQAVRNVRAAL
ncbi:MAG: 5-methyltetrahydropteroyltriglutamate--homocysteine S-methyltransferase [Campylobacterales bacterium]|nr:5-methyltetrahydropteroyltriglutamate--homocysteine S-methyltransferase [Campylobacterales bacterium]